MRVDMANRIELATTLFFVWKNSDPPPALLAGLGSVRVNNDPFPHQQLFLQQYCNFRLLYLPSFLPFISPDTDPILIRNLPSSRKNADVSIDTTVFEVRIWKNKNKNKQTNKQKHSHL